MFIFQFDPSLFKPSNFDPSIFEGPSPKKGKGENPSVSQGQISNSKQQVSLASSGAALEIKIDKQKIDQLKAGDKFILEVKVAGKTSQNAIYTVEITKDNSGDISCKVVGPEGKESSPQIPLVRGEYVLSFESKYELFEIGPSEVNAISAAGSKSLEQIIQDHLTVHKIKCTLSSDDLKSISELEEGKSYTVLLDDSTGLNFEAKDGKLSVCRLFFIEEQAYDIGYSVKKAPEREDGEGRQPKKGMAPDQEKITYYFGTYEVKSASVTYNDKTGIIRMNVSLPKDVEGTVNITITDKNGEEKVIGKVKVKNGYNEYEFDLAKIPGGQVACKIELEAPASGGVGLGFSQQVLYSVGNPKEITLDTSLAYSEDSYFVTVKGNDERNPVVVDNSGIIVRIDQLKGKKKENEGGIFGLGGNYTLVLYKYNGKSYEEVKEIKNLDLGENKIGAYDLDMGNYYFEVIDSRLPKDSKPVSKGFFNKTEDAYSPTISKTETGKIKIKAYVPPGVDYGLFGTDQRTILVTGYDKNGNQIGQSLKYTGEFVPDPRVDYYEVYVEYARKQNNTNNILWSNKKKYYTKQAPIEKIYQLEVGQNYPNPCNGMARIPIKKWDEKQTTYLMLYDTTGREVDKIEVHKSGLERNTKGEEVLVVDLAKLDLANGVYFYRLISGNMISETKKLVYLKTSQLSWTGEERQNGVNLFPSTSNIGNALASYMQSNNLGLLGKVEEKLDIEVNVGSIEGFLSALHMSSEAELLKSLGDPVEGTFIFGDLLAVSIRDGSIQSITTIESAGNRPKDKLK